MYYKCGCNDNTHTLSYGEKKENKKLDFSKAVCELCGKKIKPVKLELLEVDKKKINKVAVSL